MRKNIVLSFIGGGRGGGIAAVEATAAAAAAAPPPPPAAATAAAKFGELERKQIILSFRGEEEGVILMQICHSDIS